MHHQRELELFYSGIINILINAVDIIKCLRRYAFVDDYNIYWSNQATGTVSEGKQIVC